jgi:TolB-like protein
MKKKAIGFVVFTLFTLVAPGILYAQTLSLSDAIKRSAWEIEGKLPEKTIVAVVGFNSASKRFSDTVLEELTRVLQESGKLLVVERNKQNLELIENEMNYQMSGEVDDESMQSIGHQLGAQSIIFGSGENRGDYYLIRFRVIAVEANVIQAVTHANVRIDTQTARLLNTNTDTAAIGSTRFIIGARLGPGFELNTAHEDMVGTGAKPKEESLTAFNAALFGAFRVTHWFAIQPELNIMVNNGVKITFVDGGTAQAAYTSVDVPLLLRFTVLQTPVAVGILGGVYASFPAGKMNLEFPGLSGATSVTPKNVVFGFTAGLNAGYRIGPGHITVDLRYINDLSYVLIDYKGTEMNSLLRRSINVTAGYEFSL